MLRGGEGPAVDPAVVVDAGGVVPDSLSVKPGQAHRFYVFGLAALALLSLGLLVWTSLEPYNNVSGTFIVVAFYLGTFSVCARGIYRTCYRVEVSDGYLVMRYLYRRRVVRLEEVRRIEFIETDEESSSPKKFDVSLRDGSHFRVTANRSTLSADGSDRSTSARHRRDRPDPATDQAPADDQAAIASPSRVCAFSRTRSASNCA